MSKVAPEIKASARSVRAFLVALYEQHSEEYAALWDGLKPGAVDSTDSAEWKGDSSEYIKGIQTTGTWACYLENFRRLLTP